ncbi:AMP-binding protein [Nocardioides dubius]|uniref:Fatty-acid--CoA ligase FadD5 n=1 Tax=Nocardioides dubius TaxID=317019 RepID=A0ABN1TVF1_9ACTN
MSNRYDVIARLTAPGEPFEIRTEMVHGHEMSVFRHRQQSLLELLDASRLFGDAEYVVSTEHRISFSEHYRMVAALAAALRERYGVRPGDRVMLLSANRPEWIIGFWAAVSLGAVAVGGNSMWAAPEVAHGVELTEPVVVLADEPRRGLVAGCGAAVIAIEDELWSLIAEFDGAAMPQVDVAEDDAAVILFTSGTTGRAKGATHSHRNMIAALWFHLLNDAIAADLGHPATGRRYLLATPLFHIAALHNLAVIRLAVGDTAVIHLGRFDIEQVLALIESERVTNWGAVPTMLHRLVEADLSGFDLSSLANVSVSSAPSSAELKARLREAVPQAAKAFGTTYGLTESSSAATLATPAELSADPETVGGAVPTMQVRVCDHADRPVPDGVEGEVHIRGPLVMLGYWRNPEATAAGTASDGWFRTGDLGVMNAGRLRICSRRSDLILRGGENIYPAEVEDQLTQHPGVAECIVVGVPDADMGQAVAAVVVARPGAELDEEVLRAHLEPRLARYKIPTEWRIGTTPLPRNATGKVNRRELEVG